MNKLLLAAPASGSGKTTVTCAVLAALGRRGLRVHAFKCGPDYIDPMFHRAALGIPCHNLDLYLTPEEQLKMLFARYSAGADVAVAEGVMGFYDGVGGVTTEASAWHVADVLDLSVILVVRPKGAGLTLSSLVNGLKKVPGNATGPDAARDSHIRGILLSDCSEMLYRSLKPMLEAETGLPVLGFLPHLEDAQFESRHLGLVTAGEDPELSGKLDLLADAAEQHIDLDALLAVGAPSGEDSGKGDRERSDMAPEINFSDICPKSFAKADLSYEETLHIAVASDEAFCFCYDETLDAFRSAGMEPVLFSPLRDDHLPEDIDALYLPGGYPELYACELSVNETMRLDILYAVRQGMPTVAECGGFLYLGKSLTTPDAETYPMVGALPGTAEKTDRPVRFGYAALTSNEDTLVAPAGTPVRVHNFHYCESTKRGESYLAEKPVSGRTFTTGYGTETLYAGFPHLYFAGSPELVARIARAARNYRDKKER